MRVTFVVVLLAIGACSEVARPLPPVVGVDAGEEPPLPNPTGFDFFGEACPAHRPEPGGPPDVNTSCRGLGVGTCVDDDRDGAGTCRPQCGHDCGPMCPPSGCRAGVLRYTYGGACYCSPR